MCKSYLVKFWLILMLLYSCQLSADVLKSPTGENRIKLSKKMFRVVLENKTRIPIKTYFDNSSFEWARVDSSILLPRVRLRIKVKAQADNLQLSYKEKTLSFQQIGDDSYTELYVSLFEDDKIVVKQSEQAIATIDFIFLSSRVKEKLLIDYSCSRNQLRVIGLEDEFMSIGCKITRVGSFGKERPMLEISWYSPELRLKGSSSFPYNAVFIKSKPVLLNVFNKFTQKSKIIKIQATVPKRLHRLFTAYGFGPYSFETKKMLSNKTHTISEPTAPALMFYVNYKISEDTSIRGFEAAVFKDSTFNNAGIYLGSDFGFTLDKKLYFTTLLGVQHLYFKFDDSSPVTSEIIFPQGIEFMYRHAFGIPNYIISGGAFLSPSESIDYQNIWIRWGEKYFWELNYIYWGKAGFSAKTWGVSIGFPFKGFL